MVTLREVAKEAGVSISTISRTLSGNIPVNEETKLRVMEAVKKLNYRQNVLAKSLKEGRTNTLALIIPNIRNPIFPAVAKGVEDTARKYGYSVILSNTNEDIEQEKEYIEKLSRRWVDGFIIATGTAERDYIKELKEQNIQTVIMIRSLGPEWNTVIADNKQGGYQGMNYLLGKGHKHIALILGSLNIQLYQDRFQGCLDALNEHGMKIGPAFTAQGASGIEGGYDAMKQILQNKALPTAVFCTSDPMALGAMRAIREEGLVIPDDISVLGFDGLDISSMVSPSLTTVRQPLYEIGVKSAEIIINNIKNNMENSERQKPVLEILPVTIVERETVGAINNERLGGIS